MLGGVTVDWPLEKSSMLLWMLSSIPGFLSVMPAVPQEAPTSWCKLFHQLGIQSARLCLDPAPIWDPFLCTHLVFAFASRLCNNQIVPKDPLDEKTFLPRVQQAQGEVCSILCVWGLYFTGKEE